MRRALALAVGAALLSGCAHSRDKAMIDAAQALLPLAWIVFMVVLLVGCDLRQWDQPLGGPETLVGESPADVGP
jgi:hypothetical protein